MAASSSSSSTMCSAICTENEVKDHVYQDLKSPGPRGAYEARQVNAGFYVRVDMPGVPPDGVKIFKRGETRTVTFNGKAPRQWSDCEFYDRVYGGYVVLDRNPNDIDVEMSVVNGSLRLFFPNADGLLHFFPSKTPQSPVKHIGDEKECCHNKFVQNLLANLGDTVNPALKNMELHPSGCTCCKDEQIEEAEVFNMVANTHINPFLLDGRKGVEETGLVIDATGERMYMRVDMPGVGEKNSSFKLVNGVTLLCGGGGGAQEHCLDEGGRTYVFGLKLQCACCKIVDVKHAMKNGVSRISFRKRTNPGSSGRDCKVGTLWVP